MIIRVSIPKYRKVKDRHDNEYTVFCIEVWASGRQHFIEKRYSDFEDLHKQMKKIMRTPEFPPKKLLKWNAKVLEHRRQGLQNYIQGALDQESGILPKSLLKFLGVNILSSSFDSLDKVCQEVKVTHQPVISYPSDSFLQDNFRSSLPDVVAEGVTMGLYGPFDEILPT